MKRNFDNFITSFMEYAKPVGAPDRFLKWSAISGIAGCLERKTWVMYNGIQTIYPNLFVMLIAESGIANKSTSTRPIMELLYSVENLRFMSAQMSAAALIEQMQLAGNAKKFEFNNKTYKNSSLFSYSSEAKVTLGDSKHLNGIQELLTDFYDCGDPATWSNTKGWTKTLISRGECVIFNPCLNILYCSTPAWLLEALGKTGIEGGFASRCLFIYQRERSKANLEWRDEDEMLDVDTSTKERLIQDLTQIASMQGEFKPIKGFKDVYNKILRERNEKLDFESDSRMKPYYARKMWHLLKLSQVIAASRSNDLIIRPEYLEEANSLLLELEPEMYSGFDTKSNPVAATMEEVWTKLSKKPHIDKAEIIRMAWKKLTMKQVDELIQLLVTTNKVQALYGGGKVIYKIVDASPLR